MDHVQIIVNGATVYDSQAGVATTVVPNATVLGPQIGTISTGYKVKFGAGTNVFTGLHSAGNVRLEVVSDKDLHVGVTGGGYPADGFQAPPQWSKDFPTDGSQLTITVEAQGEGTLWMSA